MSVLAGSTHNARGFTRAVPVQFRSENRLYVIYALTVTLFSLLLGTGIGAAWRRRLDEAALVRSASIALLVIVVAGIPVIGVLTPLISWAIPFARSVRIAIAVATLVPIGMLLSIPMPTGPRLLLARAPNMIAWAWRINGSLSVRGATVAIFITMNWGFRTTLLTASAICILAFDALRSAARSWGRPFSSPVHGVISEL